LSSILDRIVTQRSNRENVNVETIWPDSGDLAGAEPFGYPHRMPVSHTAQRRTLDDPSGVKEPPHRKAHRYPMTTEDGVDELMTTILIANLIAAAIAVSALTAVCRYAFRTTEDRYQGGCTVSSGRKTPVRYSFQRPRPPSRFGATSRLRRDRRSRDWCQRQLPVRRFVRPRSSDRCCRKCSSQVRRPAGLRFKFFTFDESARRATNFYVWDSNEAALEFFSDQLRELVTDLYGVAPIVEYVQIAQIVDNSGS
jgi:hypothetical protein